jgi:hypothetical protein
MKGGRLQAKDIDEAYVLFAAFSWHESVQNDGWFMGIEGYVHMGVFDILVAEGYPPKLVEYKLERMAARKLLEYGTSVAYCWPTEKGLAMLFSKTSKVAPEQPQEAGQ